MRFKKELAIITGLLTWAFVFITLDLFLKRSKAFYWAGSIIFNISFLLYIWLYRQEFLKFLKIQPKSLIWSLSLFFLFILPYAFISVNPIASIETFYLYYYTSLLIALLTGFYIYQSNSLLSLKKLFIFLSIIILLINFYYTLFLIFRCKGSVICFFTQAIDFVNFSLLKGIVITSFPYVFFFLLFTALFFEFSEKIKYLFLFTGLYNLFILFLLGRRGALLGLLVGALVLMLLTKNKKIRSCALAFVALTLFGLLIILPTKVGKEIFIRGDRINYLLTFQYEKFAEAGSFGQRLYIWPIYLKKILEDPFSGTGLGRRVQKRALPQTNEKALKLEHAHNIFLNLALQAGIQASLAFLILYLVVFRQSYRLWKQSGENLLIGALFLFFIAYFIMSLLEGTEEGTRFTPFWMALGLLMGEWAKRNNQSHVDK